MTTTTGTSTTAGSSPARSEARDFIAENWHGADDAAWRNALLNSGWAAPTWETDAYGRGLKPREARDALAEFADADAPGAGLDVAPFHDSPWPRLLGNAVRALGTQQNKTELLSKLLTREVQVGCLLYSEPGAGSDLAGLQTRADLDGDEYVVTGQKIWTTGGHHAQFGLLLARTDWDVPKHQGISFFVIDMDSPGIEIRPIKQITGDADFNEVFLEGVRVPATRMVGAPGNGWRVLQIALAAERSGMGDAQQSMSGVAIKNGLLDAADDLIDAARAAGRAGDPVVRQEIVQVLSWRLSNNWTTQRAITEAKKGNLALANLGKLAMSRILHSAGDLNYRLGGREAMAYDYDQPIAHPVPRDLMWAFINSIGGGSDQVQRNIISERVLGLPKGYEPDKGVAFREVRKGAATRDLS